MIKERKIITSFILIIILLVGMILISTKETYATEVTGSYVSGEMTRTELQNMIVSTALSYYFNREYTDYEQRSIDAAGTFQWRDYNNPPEAVSKSNFFNTTCSTFTGISDLYSIGYDYSPYYKYSSISFQNYGANNYINRFYATESPQNFQTAYLNYGKGASASGISMMFNKLLNEYGVIPSCSSSSCSNFKYKLGDNYTKDGVALKDFASDLIYYYEIKLNNNNVTNAARTSLLNGTTSMSISATGVDYGSQDQTAIKNEIINLLQPGDNLYYLRLDDKTIKGHAMLYIGNALGDAHGFLHSAGDDFTLGDENSDGLTINTNVTIGDDNYGIWHDTWEAKIERAQISNYMFRTNSKKSFAIFITRPTNRYCNSEDKCYIGYNNANQSQNTIISEKYKGNASLYVNNSISRNKLRYLRTEQYQYFIREGESNITEYLNNYNSVNVGDIISYRVELTNESKKYNKSVAYSDSTNPDNGQIIITARIPENTEYVSCFNGAAAECNYNNGVIVWNGINISASNSDMQRFTYKVRTKSTGQVINEGMEVIYSYKCGTETCSNNLKMGSMKIDVNNTINDADVERFQEIINTKINQKKQYSDMYAFISDVYREAFDVNLGSDFTSQTIRDAIFKTMPVNWEDEYRYAENNITTLTNTSSFVRRIDYSDAQAKINNMLVPGEYGGRKLKYNVEGNRAKILFKKGIKSTLEIGDVLIFWDFPNETSTQASRAYTYIFYGYNSNNLPVFVQYNNSNNTYTKFGASDEAGYNLFKRVYAFDLFAVLRPTRVINPETDINEDITIDVIEPGTTISSLSSTLESSSGTIVTIKDKSGNNITNRNIVVTGDIVQIDNKSHFITVKGDVNSDGLMTREDARILVNYIVNHRSQYSKNYLLAGDLNNNRVIKMNDIMMILNEVNN